MSVMVCELGTEKDEKIERCKETYLRMKMVFQELKTQKSKIAPKQVPKPNQKVLILRNRNQNRNQQ